MQTNRQTDRPGHWKVPLPINIDNNGESGTGWVAKCTYHDLFNAFDDRFRSWRAGAGFEATFLYLLIIDFRLL